MTHWIPKEKLTAYQRWEVAAFDEQERTTAAPPPAEPPPERPPVEASIEPESQPQEPLLALPTAEAIERMHREAHASGYADGYQEGSLAAQAEVAKITTLMNHLQEALGGIDQGVADQLLALAIEIANQVLRQSLRVQPDLLLPVVREAVTTLHTHHGQPLLFVHPDDATLVRSHLGDQLSHHHWRIVEDATLTAGGCRVELGDSEVDATVETRWRRVIEAIGVSDEWLNAADRDSKAMAR
ncbi:flagellar assembly protein FliH [Candidatus Accumulibacter aalborgensis]|nr:flagellar assembly protein FliH [Candidatus Accumulibacter aalborgensis]